ncbi:MAG: GNAT family N-acetyltransferase [Flavobacterium sp.]|nr:GNAT family N-acetyltransferase [Flavobacterium sp.]
MIKLRVAATTDLLLIREIAYKTWPSAYSDILPKVQIDFMLDLFYSIENLRRDMEQGHFFLIAEDQHEAIGFCSYQHISDDENTNTKIHKLYILPASHGKGAGKNLVEAVERAAIKQKSISVFLNVNRHNPAIYFYKKSGFTIDYEEDIAIGHGYFMNDYVMRKTLLNL